MEPAAADPLLNPHHARRWWILVALSVAQLMVILDATVVNVALPSAQEALGFSDSSREWVVTAYALAFGSLLPLGGRLSDLFGRKWTFVAGVVGFAIASAIGGAAGSFSVLIAARVLQGVFAALLAPAALSLLNATFIEPVERNKAFAAYTAVAGSGGAVGLLIGGIATDVASWRWALYANLLFAIPTAIAALFLLVNEGRAKNLQLDLPGTATVSAGLFGVVFGLAKAETDGWGSTITLVSLIAGGLLLVAFVAIQRVGKSPLMPLRIVLDRTRGAALVTLLLGSLGLFAAFLFLTYFLQLNLGLSPLKTGLAFLPLPVALTIVASIAQTVLLPKVGPRPLFFFGLLVGAGGLVLLAQLHADSSWAGGVLPGLTVLGAGLGAALATGFNAATFGVRVEDSGAAGALVNTSQQVGLAVGLALLSTIAATATSHYLVGKPATATVVEEATVHGYTVAFWWGAAIFVAAAFICGALVRPGATQVPDPTAATEPEAAFEL